MPKPLLRHTLDIYNIENLNVEISALQKMIDFYEDYLNREGEYQYVTDRVNALLNRQAEFLIAREYSSEGAKTFGTTEEEQKKSEDIVKGGS